MSKLQNLLALPEGMSVRRVTLADREEVIKVHDNVKDGLDRLTAYYDYWMSLPEVFAVGLFCEEKMIGFLFTMVIDGGSTAVIRMSRINPEYQGRKLQRSMFYYVAYWAVKEMGAKSIVSTEEETGPLQDNKHGRYRTRVFISWKFVQVRLDPQDFEPIHAGDQLIIADLDGVSDKRLSELFQNSGIRDYIAPKGILMVHSVPLKPIESNIPFIRGLEGSTHIYSDLKQNDSECHGLLSCSSKYAMPEGGSVGNVFKLDIFGDDPSSLRKHFMRHLTDMTKISEDKFALNITLPEGFDLDEIGQILKTYNIEIEEWRLTTSTSSRVHLVEWLRDGKELVI